MYIRGEANLTAGVAASAGYPLSSLIMVRKIPTAKNWELAFDVVTKGAGQPGLCRSTRPRGDMEGEESHRAGQG